jgi:hypothetical protein
MGFLTIIGFRQPAAIQNGEMPRGRAIRFVPVDDNRLTEFLKLAAEFSYFRLCLSCLREA